MMRDFWILSRTSAVQTKNRLFGQFATQPILFTFILGLVGLFYYGFLRLSDLLTGFIFQQDVFGVILITKLVQIMLIISIGIVLMSALTTAIANFYMSKDLEFQFCLPVNFDAWVLHRYAQVYVQSCWMVLAFGSPLIWDFLTLSGIPIGARLLGLVAFAIVCTVPVFVSSVLCMFLVRVFPARRIHQILLVFTMVLMASLVFLFRYLEPEQFVGPGGIDKFRGYIDLVNPGQQSWNPAIWASDFIAALSQKEWRQCIPSGIRLALVFFASHTLLIAIARRYYRPSWDRALQALSGEVHGATTAKSESRLSQLLANHRWSQVGRELLLLKRDPSQWSQIFVLLSLLALYLFSITKLPLDPFGGTRYQLALGNTAFVGFVALSIATRFVFTSFSLEGQSLWLLKIAPQRWSSWILAKIAVFGLPTISFAMLLSAGSGWILNLDAIELVAVMTAAFWDASTLVALSLAFGLVFINTNIENPLKLMVSPGGFLLMALGFFVMGLHVMLRMTHQSPFLNVLMSHVGWPDVQGPMVYVWGGGLIAVEFLLVVTMMRRGMRQLIRNDIT